MALLPLAVSCLEIHSIQKCVFLCLENVRPWLYWLVSLQSLSLEKCCHIPLQKKEMSVPEQARFGVPQIQKPNVDKKT